MATFEVSFQSTSLAAVNGTYNIVFTTGALGAVFTARNVGFSGASGRAIVYEAPAGVTGGTPTSSYRLNLRNTNVATGTLTVGATVGGVGTQVSSPTYYRGSIGNGQTTVGTFAAQATVRTLKPNTTYLLQFVNTDPTNAQIVDFYLQWYEGKPN